MGTGVPFYDDANRAWGAIKRVMALPCAIPTAVYVEAAVHGAWKAAFSIIEPDPKELYHNAFGQSFAHSVKNVVEEAHILPAREDSALTRFLFTGADIYDVSLWYLFLFSSVTSGLIDFGSQVQRHSGCNATVKAGQFTGGSYINAIGDDGSYYANLFLSNDPGSIAISNCETRIGGRKTGFCAATCKFSDFDGLTDVPTATSVINTGTGAIMDTSASNVDSSGNANHSHVWYDLPHNGVNEQIFQPMSCVTGGMSLPLHEAFRSGDQWYGNSYASA
jgi:hypothetical protein